MITTFETEIKSHILEEMMYRLNKNAYDKSEISHHLASEKILFNYLNNTIISLQSN